MLQRLGYFLLAALFAAGAGFVVAGFMSRPPLFDGDRLGSRPCRRCDRPARASCLFCAGRGKVSVVSPGGRRPTWIVGAVVDGTESLFLTGLSEDEPLRMRWIPAALPPFPNPPPRLVPDARVLAVGAGGRRFEDSTMTRGIFALTLPPGAYAFSVSKPGYAPFERTLEIPAKTSPVWIEKAFGTETEWEGAPPAQTDESFDTLQTVVLLRR